MVDQQIFGIENFKSLTKYPLKVPTSTQISSISVPYEESESIPFEWTWYRTIISLILGSIVLCTILGNSLVLYSFLSRRRELRSPTHCFVANLALCDFFVGTIAMPFLAVLHITGRWYFGSRFCLAWIIIHTQLCSTAILSTCAVCIERYIGVKYPLQHLTIMSLKRVSWMISGIWALAASFVFCAFVIFPEERSEMVCISQQGIGSVVVYGSNFFISILYIPSIIMVILYWQIYRIATRQLKKFENVNSIKEMNIGGGGGGRRLVGSKQNDNHPDALASARSTRKQIRLAKRIAIFVGILLISYVPFFTAFLIFSFNHTAFDVLGWIRYFNSCINPFIYAFALPSYRKAFKSIVFRGWCH